MSYFTFREVCKRMTYPAGESHLSIRPNRGYFDSGFVIEAIVTSFERLGEVFTADRALKRLGAAPTWFMPYFPFARHDRRLDRFDGFELGTALEMVEGLDVIIADPHSDVAGQLRHIPQSSCVELFRENDAFKDNPVIVIPDAGATKKAMTWIQPGDQWVQALKHRDPSTGKLSQFEVLRNTGTLRDRPCIIVDDICDGGGTFLGLAEELKKLGAGDLTLAVTHGLFTKGYMALTKRFQRIYTFHGAADALHPDVFSIRYQRLYERGMRAAI